MTCIVHISQANEITNPKVVRNFFEQHKPGKHLITSKELSKRSNEQNAFLHVLFGLLVQPLRDAGWDNVRTMLDAKALLKSMLLKERVINPITGEAVDVILRTRDLSKERMAMFIDDLYRLAADYLGTILPEPEKQITMFDTLLATQFDNGILIEKI